MTTAISAPSFVSMREAAQIFGVHPHTIRRWIASGDLEAVRIGPRFLRVRVDAHGENIGRPVLPAGPRGRDRVGRGGAR